MNEKIEIAKGVVISKDMLELLKKRIAAMPSNMRIAILGRVLSKDEILKEIEKGTELGKEFLLTEFEYYRYLLKGEENE